MLWIPFLYRSPSFRTHLAALLFSGAAVGTLGCGSTPIEETLEAGADLPEISEATLTVTPRNWPTIVRSMGSFQADEESTVGAKISGMVNEVHVELGDRVRAGDRLVTLDQQQAKLLLMQAEAQLQQARAAIGMSDAAKVEDVDPDNSAPVREAKATWSEAQTSLKRAARLLRQNAMAQSEYDQFAAGEQVAAARHQAAVNGVRERISLVRLRQAELEVAKQRLEDTVVKSPFDGFVQRRSVAPGTYLSVGQSLATIVRTDPLRFRGSVPERYAMSVTPGQEVRLIIASLEQPILATVTRITPALDQRSRALIFEADVPNANSSLQTGIFAEAEIVVASEAVALAIPQSAVVEFAGTQKVWKVTDGLCSEQTVLVGPIRDGLRKIVEGVSLGDTLLVNGQAGRVARITTKAGGGTATLAAHDAVIMEEANETGEGAIEEAGAMGEGGEDAPLIEPRPSDVKLSGSS